MDASTEQKLLATLRELTLSQNREELQHLLQAHPELLERETIALFGHVIARLEELGQFKDVQSFRRYYDLLLSVRKVGIEQAIDEAAGGGGGVSPELRAILSQLSGPEPPPERIPESIQRIERGLALASPEKNPDIWCALQGMLGSCLRDHPMGDRAENLESALNAYEQAGRLLSKETRPILWAINTNNIGKTYAQRVRGNPEENIQRALAAFRAALEVLTGEAGPRILSTDSEANLVTLATGSLEDLQRAIDYLQKILLTLDNIAASAGDQVDIPKLELLLRYRVGLEPLAASRQDNATALHTGEDTWSCVLPGARLLTEYWATNQPEKLFQALESLQNAANSISQDSPARPDLLDLLGKAQRAYHERLGALEVLQKAIDNHEQALSQAGAESTSRAHYLVDLSEDLIERYRQIGKPADLDRAIDLARQATELVASGSSERPTFLRVLGNHLRTRYSDRGVTADLEAAIRVIRQALELAPPTSPDRVAILQSLAGVLFVRYGHIGEITDLNEAIQYAREGFKLTPGDSPERAALLYALGHNLQRRYHHMGDIADLEEAIQFHRRALALIPVSSPDRVEFLDSLGSALNHRYDQTGEAKDLEESIGLWQQAFELLPAASPDRAHILNQLSVGLRGRYYRTGDVVDLERAIELSRQTVSLVAPNSPSRPAYLIGLGIGLYQRHLLTTELADLDRANALWQEAADAVPASDPERREALSSLGTGLYRRYRYTHDLADLEKSIQLWQEATELTPPSSPDRAGYLSGLAGGLVEHFDQQEDTVDFKRAIALLQQAVELAPPGTSSRADFAGNLAIALGKRYDRAGDPADLEKAGRLFQEAASLGLSTNLESALTTSLVWGDWAFGRKSWTEAARAFSLAAQAVDGLLDNQLLRTGKETWLGKVQELPSHAAFALAQTGNLERAVEFLERGRVRLLAEAQERDRIDLECLKEIGHAERYEAYRSAVERVGQLERRQKSTPVTVDVLDTDAAMKAAHARVRTAIEAICQVPGYQDLFHAPDFSQIQRTLTAPFTADAAAGVCVYLTITRAGGVALIVHAGGVRKVWLDFDQNDLIQLLVKRRNGHIVGGYLMGQFESYHLPEELDKLLPWLGDKLLQPLLEALQDIVLPPRSDKDAPAVFVIPTGVLGLLPMHACSYQVKGKLRVCLEDCAITYVLSARALGHSRAALQSAPVRPPSFFGIGNPLPLPEGVEPLTFAKAEVEEIARLFGEAGQVMCETQATRAALESNMGKTTYLHLSCHAQFNPHRPLSSGFILGNGKELGLGDLLARPKLQATRLAVLSACQTAISDFNNLPEEAVGLPAGFLQTGVPGVVGALWQVNDISTALLLIKFYEFHLEKGWPQPAPPAQALRRAQLWLRDVSANELAAHFDAERRKSVQERTMSYEQALRCLAALYSHGAARRKALCTPILLGGVHL